MTFSLKFHLPSQCVAKAERRTWAERFWVRNPLGLLGTFRKLIGTARWPSSLNCENEYLVFALREETAV